MLAHGVTPDVGGDLAARFLVREPEEGARSEAVRLLHRTGGPAAVLRLLHHDELAPGLVGEALGVLHELRERIDWETVQGLWSRLPRSAHHQALRLFDEAGAGSLRKQLLRLFVRERLDPTPGEWRLGAAVVPKLHQALRSNGAPLDDEERELRRALAAFIDRTMAEAKADPEAFDLHGDPAGETWFLAEERRILGALEALSRR